MKVILTEDVKSLGKKGEIVNVSDGYARNFILKKNKGVEANGKNLNDLKLKKANDDKIAQQQYEDAQELGKKIEAGKIEVAIKMGEGGKAFGSVSSKEIAEEVKKQMDLTIDKKKVQLKEAIRTLGTHNVPVKLHPKVTAELKVVVKEEAWRNSGVDEALIKRVMPHSIEAEQSVVGAMLMDKDAITTAGEIISGDDFYQASYGVIFDSMIELFNEGKPVDLITLQERLKEKDVPAEIASLEFVRDLVTAVPTSANVKYYAQIVADKSLMRKMIKLNESIENMCYAGKEPVESIMEQTEKSMFQLLQRRTTGDYVPIKQVVLNALDKIEKASKSKGTVTGIPTGFIDLDYKLSGFQPSDFILIAARPSMGKTAFVLNIAQYMAFKKNKAVAIFSLEMSKEQLVNRLFSLESQVDAQSLRTGNMKDSDWEKLIEGAGIIGQSKLIIDDTPGISISELRSKCRKYKLEHGLDIIIIDYLQLMTGSVGRSSESRQQEVSDISRQLKGLARELNVPVVSLSQLSRAVESRPDKRPMLSDLRESGAIEQDADVVMFIYRDEYYNKDSEFKKQAEIIIAKQRNGPVGTVNLAWLGEYTKFANLSRQEDSF